MPRKSEVGRSRSQQVGKWALQRFGFSSLPYLLTSVLLLLVACGRSATGHRDTGTIVFLIESMPANLDPRIGTDAQSQRIHSLIFSGLLERDENMNLRGDLAERWEQPDPLTYIFHLRRDVKFHNGEPLTAADVKYTFDSILNGEVKTPKRGAFRMVASVTAPDDYTVVFKLKEPFASFLWNVTRPSVGIVPRSAANMPDFAAKPIGTGPFAFISARQDDEIQLQRPLMETFMIAPDPAKKRPAHEAIYIRFRIVPDATVRALELRKGAADAALNSLNPDMVPALAKHGGIEVTETPGTTLQYLALNLEDPILSKREVRQALAYATDREAMVKHLLRGQARLADSLLPPNHWAYAKAPPEFSYSYSPQRAEQLLDAAGYPRRANGVRLSLAMKISTDENARLIAAVLQEQWRRVGVELELRPYEFATLYSDITRGSFQLYTLRWIGANNDPDIFEYVFHSKKMPPDGANRGHYRNPRLDALLDEARIESDREKRKRLYAEAQRIVAEDVPYINLWYLNNVCVHRARLGNVKVAPAGDYDFLKDVVLAAGRN